MKKSVLILMVLFLCAGVSLAATSERWLHVRVVDGQGDDQETVRVNVPLSLAEKVLPAINVDQLQNGKIRIDKSEMKIDDVDFRTILDAVRETEDGEFVTVEGTDETVRVAKSGGYFLVKVREEREGGAKVDVKIPFEVVDALFGADPDELDIAAALRALGEHGDIELVTVSEKDSRVRIWIDSKNTSDE